jgi:hypothetical protein
MVIQKFANNFSAIMAKNGTAMKPSGNAEKTLRFIYDILKSS